MTNVSVPTDERAFQELVARHHRELHVHCYRMLGSFDEAEDLVQETYLRAWRHRDSFEGTTLLRAWLYRIATNACLDELRRRKRRPATVTSYADLPHLQPYPDALLDEVGTAEDDGPDVVAVARETIELAFLAAMQALPPNQRAVLIVRDVLGWSAQETAELLGLSVPAANSALQRARATLATRLPGERGEWSVVAPTAAELDVLARFIDSHERGDVEAAAAMVRDDIRVSMPPDELVFDGKDALLGLVHTAFGDEFPGEWKLVATRANRLPAALSYYREPGKDEFVPFKFDILRVVDGRIAEITTFPGRYATRFGLPATLPA